MGVHSMIQFDLMADLKAYDVSSWGAGSLQTSALLVGRDAIGDNKGGLYQWDGASSATEDLTNMNVLASTTTSTGRWLRVFQRALSVPQGILVMNGGVKTLYVQMATNSSGEAQIYLTYDNTSTGSPIFSEIWENKSTFRGDASSITNAVQSYVKISGETGLYKTTTHGYYKVQAINILLGGIIAPITSVGPGVPVVFSVVGV